MQINENQLSQQTQFNTWYRNQKVLHKLIRHTQNKEFCLLEPKHLLHSPPRNTRNLRAHNTQAISFILFKLLKCQERGTIYNLYSSTATYTQGVPYSNPNLAERNMAEWKENYWKQINEVDFFLDIDAPSHDKMKYAKEDAIAISGEMKMGHEIRFTGCGFHILVPKMSLVLGNQNFEPLKDGNVWREMTQIAEQFEDTYTELIDTNLNDSRRVIKIPYSLSFYPKGTYVCSPLSFQGLKDFDPEDYTYEKFDMNKLNGGL
jgi:hypothetical protein